MENPTVYLLEDENLSCLGQDFYLAQLAGWVLDNIDDSRFVQEKIMEGADRISLAGYGILWQKLRIMEGWEEVLWHGLSKRKHPTQDCIELVSKNNGVQSMASMYTWLHGCLSERSEHSALLLSQSLALQAANFTMCGIWTGADLLMREIIGKHGGVETLVDGRYNWWEAAAIVLKENMEKHEMTNSSVMRSGLLREPVLTYISILEGNRVCAGQDTVNCGHIFSRAVDVDEYTYLPLLNAWIGAGGNWEGLWEVVGDKIREMLARHPVVRRSRLMGMIPDDLERSPGQDLMKF